MKGVRLLVALLLAALATGCVGWPMLGDDADAITVTDVDGSEDHRIFRVGCLTPVLLEPVVWRLVDSKKIDLDWSLSDCLTALPIPEEHRGLTLRALLAGGNEDLPDDDAYALFWLAVSERLRMSPDELLGEYLVKPYGLTDTSFEPVPSRRSRLVNPEAVENETLTWTQLFSEGLLTSSHDILRVAYVMLPHVAARSRARLQSSTLLCGNEILYALWESSDGAAFLGLDVESKRVILCLTTASEVDLPDLLVKMEGLAL